MGDLLVRDVPDDVVKRLEEPACLNGRSVEAEHREVLRRALTENDNTRIGALAVQMRVLTGGRPHTPSEGLQREGRDER